MELYYWGLNNSFKKRNLNAPHDIKIRFYDMIYRFCVFSLLLSRITKEKTKKEVKGSDPTIGRWVELYSNSDSLRKVSNYVELRCSAIVREFISVQISSNSNNRLMIISTQLCTPFGAI